MDLNTLSALETFLTTQFFGVLLVVSHDRFFTDKVTNHLFVFEGDGVVKDFPGTLTEYAECLVAQEEKYGSSTGGGGGGTGATTTTTTTIDDTNADAAVSKKDAYKQSKAERFGKQNTLKKSKREITKLETEMEERLKPKIVQLEQELEEKSSSSSADNDNNAGWTVLAELTETLNAANEELEEKELRWMELAELVETLEAEIAEEDE
mmetsp:Transcript_38521/g.57269  ORF Transcript_38521/g.57269 Transcript_38521/m.57269 type:complete len:208 (-) Transcript_38521:146-769(-)